MIPTRQQQQALIDNPQRLLVPSSALWTPTESCYYKKKMHGAVAKKFFSAFCNLKTVPNIKIESC
jgi:hypothetical protein